MKRRSLLVLLTAAALAAAVPGRAQAPALRRLAWMGLGRADLPSPYLEALRAGLAELGWVEGRNLTISRFWNPGTPDDGDKLAREVIASQPEIIVSQEFNTISLYRQRPPMPVVFGVSGDPVDAGVVRSFARPGGNFTGISYLAIDLVGKRIELLRETVPSIRHVGILARPQHPGEQAERQASEAAVRKLGLTLTYFPIRNPRELGAAFQDIAQARCDALVLFPDSMMFAYRETIARYAAEAKLPAVSGWGAFADGGLLLTYGPNLHDLWRRVAVFVDRILDGDKPSELPVELPDSVELVVNLRTAAAMGLTVPPSIVARADRAID